jgi:hypothetical protein
MALNLNFKNSLAITFLLITLFSSCKNNNRKSIIEDSIDSTAQSQNYIEVVSTGMDFELINEIQSGWTTFKYVNNSEDPHFFIFEKMPDGIGIEDYKKELIPPFMTAFNHFDKGNVEAGMKELEKIPEWFSKVELAGGVGLTSPHSVSESTIYLHPGVYVMECYVRMPNGLAHAFMGMIKELVVKEENNNQKMPISDFEISLSSENGISFVDSLKMGDYSLSVNFEDQKQYETMLGHDINLVKLENEQLLNSLNNWINAADIKAFRTPAPKGLIFLGGVEDLPSGSKGFFNVSLEKGDYVLISEIPDALQRKMYKTFKVY